MNQFFKQFAAVWSKLGINQKATIILILVAFTAGLAALVHVSGRPSYELLYSDLDEKDMAAVVSYLKDNKVGYQVTDGGRSIMVAEGRKYDMRLGLASKGVVTGGRVGLELWDAPGWGASPMAEQMMKRRAIQGELARTIMHVEQIAWADVQVAQGEESLFARDERPTTAAITLKMQDGRSLSPVQVAGICRLVAGSVEGLTPDNVTIIDENGNLLTQARSDMTTAAAADAHNYQRAYEEYLASKAQSMLDSALGHGKSVVKVSADLDMSQATETREDYDPNNRVARSEKFMSKSSASPDASSGAAGTQAEETSETQYEVPRTVRTLDSAPGAVRRLDVAVIVDPSYLDAEGNEATLTQPQLDELGTIVKRAVGLVEGGARNDSFQLTAMPFNTRPTKAPDATAETTNKREFMMQTIRYGSAILAALVFVIFAGLGLRRVSRASAAGAATPGSPALYGMEMMTMGNGNGNGHIRNRVKDLIAKDPAIAARLLQRWVAEDDTKKGNRNG
jgi:flagellar M-ring protein FliF